MARKPTAKANTAKANTAKANTAKANTASPQDEATATDDGGLMKVKAPAFMVGCSTGGQVIGKDRIISVERIKGAELCRSHGFEAVK